MVGVAVRILQAVGARLRRTIRMDVRDGEDLPQEHARISNAAAVVVASLPEARR